MEALKKQFEENHRTLISEQNVSEQRLQNLESAVVRVETDRKAYLRKHAQDLIELKQVLSQNNMKDNNRNFEQLFEAEQARLEAKAQEKTQLFDSTQAANNHV